MLQQIAAMGAGLLEEGWLDLLEQEEHTWHWGDLSLRAEGDAAARPHQQMEAERLRAATSQALPGHVTLIFGA